MDIAELYASKYDFIHVYSYENAGISTTRNRALEKATGDYYLFVDSDDYLNPHMIEKMKLLKRKVRLLLVDTVLSIKDYQFQ